MAASMPASVVKHITSFLELAPGTRATPARLNAIMQAVANNMFGVMVNGGGTEGNAKHTTILATEDGSGTRLLRLKVKPATEDEDDAEASDPIFKCNYPWTPDGMLAAIVDAKTAIADDKLRVACPD